MTNKGTTSPKSLTIMLKTEIEKRKIIQKRYDRSNKRKVSSVRYKQSEKGKEVHKRAKKKYDKSEKGKIARRKRIYGLTLEDYNKLVEKQEGKCAICGRLDDNLHVDHDHKTGQVRGLLCKLCNPLLGLAGDNIDILLNAVRYLKETK